MLSRDARRLNPELELDTLLHPFTGDKLKLLHAAIIAFWLACWRVKADLDFPASRLLGWCNVYLSASAAEDTPIWL